mmetsp:Transcript_6263/g.8147  ORF Transcript_6263/g.8147 Transcript_6263/m.8147 type:complete len:124 (+) Transcript_6263:402-773(+)
MVETHKQPDVVEYCGHYVRHCFERDINEACWFQLPLSQYLSYPGYEYRKKVGIPDDCCFSEDQRSELVMHATNFFGAHFYHQDGKQMIEVHLDGVQALIDARLKEDNYGGLNASCWELEAMFQ